MSATAIPPKRSRTVLECVFLAVIIVWSVLVASAPFLRLMLLRLGGAFVMWAVIKGIRALTRQFKQKVMGLSLATTMYRHPVAGAVLRVRRRRVLFTRNVYWLERSTDDRLLDLHRVLDDGEVVLDVFGVFVIARSRSGDGGAPKPAAADHPRRRH